MDETCWLNEDCVLEANHDGACKFNSWFATDDNYHVMHGNVDVTSGDTIQTIGRWQARRREPLHDPDQVSHYECRVRFNDEQWNTEFVIEHVYSDGIGVLIQKIFTRYTEIKAKAKARAKEQLTPKNRIEKVPKPRPKSDHLDQMELERDLRAIQHREEE